MVAVAFLWETMLNPQYGIVNTWLSEPIAFLSQAKGEILGVQVPVALLTVIAFEAWRYFPFAFLFILARLQALPAELDEAAVVDGATPTQRFRYVIMPQLWRIIALLSVLRFVFTFTKFDDVYLLTGGGAGTEVVSVRVYNFLTSRDDIGASAAQAIVLAVFLVVLLAIYLRFFAGVNVSRDRFERGLLKVLKPLVVAFLFLITAFPFCYMVMLSVRDIQELILDPGSLWPRSLTLDTYVDVLTRQGFLTFLKNSTIVAVASVAVTLLISIPGAYAVARLRFFGRRQVHFLFLAVYLFPAIVLAIPLFVLFTMIGLRGSLIGLILVYIAQTVPVTVYMLRNYFETVPQSVEEAAAIDGCTRLSTIWRVVLPLSKPALMATGLYAFMIAWNEFLFALLFLVERRENWTVSLGLSQLAGSIEIPTTVLMAGSVVLTLPIVIVFFAGERLLTAGLTAGAEKG
ncbi:ABC transporter permease subunit [Nonomuraea antimicrobica]